MFYETSTNEHGLAHDPYKAIVAPRPIGWIGTYGTDGTPNLGPYSFFNAISDHPKMVMFSSDGVKDSVRNAEASGEFTANLVSGNLKEAMNQSSVPAPPEIDEFEYSGLTPVKGELINAPRIGEAFACLECKVADIFVPKTVDGTTCRNTVVIGQVVGIHISEEIIANGRIDMKKAAPVARLGYRDYCQVSEVFEMIRPSWES